MTTIIMEHEKIKEIIESVLARMSIDYEKVDPVDSGVYTTFLIRTKDTRILIGNRGETLDALSFIVRRIVEKKCAEGEERPLYIIDVNNYQSRKIEELLNTVQLSAKRAKLFRQDVELSPMSSYERMIVHSAFSEDDELKTESEGEGKFRRIIFKYKGHGVPKGAMNQEV